MISPLEKIIGYTFDDKSLLKRALTHASKSPHHLERQEFLGDAVLGLVIADYLHNHHQDSAEGDLSKMRANLVCKQALLHIAKLWQLSHYLQVGDGERFAHGALKSESIAANAVESIIGAVFQDAGWTEAQRVVLFAWSDTLENVQPVNLRDAKSALQELTQGKSLGLPSYEVKDMGVNQSPRFEASCYLQTQCLGVGRGAKKKTAEIQAASSALVSNTFAKLMGK